MLLRLSLVFCALSVIAVGQRISYPQLILDPVTGFGLPYDSGEVAALSLPNGDTVFIGKGGHIVHLNSSGTLVANQTGDNGFAKNSPVQLGTGHDDPNCAKIDAAGNIWIAGATDSLDFPLLNPIFAKRPATGSVAFLLELDPTASMILFSTLIGGMQGDWTEINAIAFDGQGNLYVTGDTDQPDFPTTLPEFGVGLPYPVPANDTFTSSAIAGATYGFVVKVNMRAVPTLGWSVLLGGSTFLTCGTGEDCNVFLTTHPAAVLVDSTGAVVVAGGSNATDYPVTPGAYQTSCQQCLGGAAGFVTSISADGKSLLWSTYVGNPVSLAGVPGLLCDTAITAAVLDSAGNLAVAGSSCNLPVTPDAFQGTPPVWGIDHYNSGGFAAKLSGDGKTLLYATYLGGMYGSSVSGVALDRSGNVWVAGTTTSLDFLPAPLPQWGEDYLVELNSTASAFQQAMRLPTGTVSSGLSTDPNGELILLADAGIASRLDPKGLLTSPAVFALTNGASFMPQAGLCPYQLFTVFGSGLGPSAGISAAPDGNGAYPTELGGTEVLVGGIPAPLFWVGPNQINFQSPDFSQVVSPTIEIRTADGSLGEIPFSYVWSLGVVRNFVIPNAPGTLAESAIAAALNQDLSVNSYQNRAAPGSIVTIYLTEPYMPSGGSAVGSLATEASSAQELLSAIEVTDEYSPIPLPVIYAGTAPGMTNAVIQVNVMLPSGGDHFIVSAPELGISDTVYIW